MLSISFQTLNGVKKIIDEQKKKGKYIHGINEKIALFGLSTRPPCNFYANWMIIIIIIINASKIVFFKNLYFLNFVYFILNGQNFGNETKEALIRFKAMRLVSFIIIS